MYRVFARHGASLDLSSLSFERFEQYWPKQATVQVLAW